jgi:hypothetical protein
MIFPMGSTFIFGSWVYEMDNEGNLHGHLVEASKAHMDLTLLMGLAEDLAERFSGLTMPESAQALTRTDLDSMSESDSSSASTLQEINSNLLQVFSKKLGRFPTGLNSMAKTYQDSLQGMTGWIQKLQLTRAQEGLMLTITPEDCLVHWPGTYPLNSNVQLVEEAITLPYQRDSTLRDANTPTKVLDSKGNLEPGRESFMIRRPLPMPPTAPDVRSLDELESNISPNVPKYDGESEGQR